MSRAAQVPYSPELFERIARLCIRMGDMAEAGRWYAVIASTDEAAPRAIEVFLGRCKGNEWQILSQIPHAAAQVDAANLPAAVRKRFPSWDKARQMHGRCLSPPLLAVHGPVRKWLGKIAGKIAWMGCLAIFVFVLVCTVVGFSTMARGLADVLRR